MSRILELIGRLRLPLPRLVRPLRVGDPAATDVGSGQAWRDYLTPESLYDLWGPVEGSPWEPFHCVTLFASLDSILTSSLGPTPPEEVLLVEGREIPRLLQGPGGIEPPPWTGRDCLLMIDLPGPQAVAAGARFVAAGFQPVCTFDHWPHPAGLLKPETVLAELLRQAPAVAEARQRLTRVSPPVWISDRERLGTRTGRPREFDNRYYLDDSLLPGPELLRTAGVRRLICLLPQRHANLIDDLGSYLSDLQRQGFSVYSTALADPELGLDPLRPAARKRKAWSGYRRTSAGGFGVLIPEPSSSSG